MKEVLKRNFREMVCKLCMSIFSSVNTSISMSLRPYSVRLSARLSACSFIMREKGKIRQEISIITAL